MWYIYTQWSIIHKEQNYVIFMKIDGLQVIILSEIIQTQKTKSHVFTHMWNLGPK
jgi:hypothetical protein